MVILVVNWQFVQYNAWDGSALAHLLLTYVEYVSLGHKFMELSNYVNG